MGCGCKQQPKQSSGPKIIRVNESVEMVSEPLYTEEDIIRLENWLIETNRTSEETYFVYQFNEIHFGEKIQGYCDIHCQHRIRKRIEHMKEKLNKWKNDQ